MSYPFADNPLDDYLQNLRIMKAEEYFLYRLLPNVRGLEKTEILRKISDTQEKLKEKRKQRLPARNCDVFVSENEARALDFDSKNPQPIFKVCAHDKTEPRIKVFSNKTTHIWLQCIECGKCCGSRKKCDCPGWGSYAAYDEGREHDFNAEYYEWQKKRTELFLELWSPEEDFPVFDWDAFSFDYKKNNPEPLHPSECSHVITKNTIRVYSNGSSAVVEQCCSCGKHVKSLPKSSFSDFEGLEKFDEDFGKNIKVKCGLWFSDYSQSLELAKREFHEDLSLKIAAGIIVPVDKSRFGTYYESVQWKKTRQRIFVRDGFSCQSCSLEAGCVHHITYERLGCENDLDLISLCNRCHDFVHKKQNEYPFSYRLSPSEIKSLFMKFEDEN